MPGLAPVRVYLHVLARYSWAGAAVAEQGGLGAAALNWIRAKQERSRCDGSEADAGQIDSTRMLTLKDIQAGSG